MTQPSLFPLSSEARRIPGRMKKYRCKYKTPRITWQRVEKLLDIYNDIPPAEREYNRHWYWRAHNICHNISLNTTVPMRNTVAVMAALSVNVGWERNVKECRAICTEEDISFTTYGKQVEKAYALRDCDDVDVERVLCKDPMLSGMKTYRFFKLIEKPWRNDLVCIDSHAISAARGVKLSNKNPLRKPTGYQYRCYEADYLWAARTLGLRGCELQAIVWCRWREMG